jgi:peptide chain release factor 3
VFVIARNSSFTFKGKAVDIKEVGRRLGVRYVLQGAVRKASGKVRITGQLIEAATGAHIWADKFERDMTVSHSRSVKKVRLSSSHKLFGNERETVDEAYPGDIIGLVGHDSFGIGDTLTTDPGIRYNEIPRFTPEAFAYLHNPNTAKFKQFRQGLDQLLQEGVVQVLHLRGAAAKVPLLAAVGPLQFEVVQYRLESEYGATSRLEPASWSVVRWLPADMTEDDLDAISLPTGTRLAYDMGQRAVVLLPNEWSANYFAETNPRVPLSSLPIPPPTE